MAKIALGAPRACSKCGITKPWAIDYFRPLTNGGKASLRHTCRKCQGHKEGDQRGVRHDLLTDEERAVAKQRYNRNFFEKDPDHARAIWRAASKRNSDHRKKYQKRYREENSQKVKADNRAWRENNRERLREYMKEYGPKWAEQNREKRRAAVKRWRQAHPKKAHHSTQRYWARKHGAEGSHTFRQKKALLDQQRHLCFYCQDPLTEYHADHFIPLSRGGTDFIENIRMSCPSCNCRKSNKMPWEWLPARFPPP